MRQPKDHPLLMTGQMIPPTKDGLKTHTRRIGNRYKNWKKGDRIWVRETHWLYGKWVENGTTKTGRQKWKFKRINDGLDLRFPGQFTPGFGDLNTTKNDKARYQGWWKRPSIFMERRDSRITLELTADVWQQNTQSISDEDIKKEGVVLRDINTHRLEYSSNAKSMSDKDLYRYEFEKLWNSINSKPGRTWEDNPEVNVIELKVVEP
jgi:hypothetical protein